MPRGRLRGPGCVLAVALAVSFSTAPRAVRAHKGSGSPALAPVVLGRFSTTYSRDAEHKGRAINVELAAEAIDGKVIAPGATFSFNEAVGERTAAFGYSKATILRDGMIAEGMGGGACQTASTLHAAALLAGLDVVERAPHSRPSAYIRMGLDATVVLGGRGPAIDLKLRNRSSSVVTLRTRTQLGTLSVWFEAAQASRPEVSVTSEIVERTAFERTVMTDMTVSDEHVRLVAYGIPGFRVRRIREVRSVDGAVLRDVRIDVYPPSREVLRVGPSFDASRLERRESSESEDANLSRSAWLVSAALVRPHPVQLRPSLRIVLTNSSVD
jgi:VanW like protein